MLKYIKDIWLEVGMKKVIGIDLGGTSIIGGILNEKGQILKRKR